MDLNSVSVTKSWDFAIAYNISKSTFAALLSNDDQEFLDTGNTEQVESYSLGWVWQITGVSSLSVVGEFEQAESQDADGQTESDFFDLDIEYQKALSPKTDFDITYSYSEGEFDDDDDGEFNSNTISVGIVHRF